MAIKNKPFRLIPLSRIILAKLYEQHVNDNPKDRFTAEDIAELFSIPVSKNLIASALTRLHNESKFNEKLVIRRGIKAEQYGFVIGDYGIQVIEKGILKKNTDIAHYMAHGDSVIEEIAGLEGRFFTQDELMEREDWVPLEIDREAPEYTDAIEAVEEAAEIIRKDNGFAAHYPLEREGILGSLQEGLEWLKKKSPSRAQIKALLMAPLNWVASVFGNAIVGETAKKAAQKLADLIFSFF